MMRDVHRIVLFVVLLVGLWANLGVQSGIAAPVPPPEIASYTIEAAYAPADHTIIASQTATYVNRTETAIPDLVFHLYLNAFRSEDTLWMREAGPAHRGFQYSADAPGRIVVDRVALDDGSALTLEPVDADETLVRAVLPEAVAPGDAVTVRMDFTATLPRVFARTGWADEGDFVMAGQWFPKFGVWEEGAWSAHPFHANSEFYADFGTYDVAVTLPEGWRIGATGVLVEAPVDNGDGTATHTFYAEHVIDFAWGASPHFRTLTTHHGDVDLEILYYPGQRAEARRVLKATTGGLDVYHDWYGAYGRGLYPELTVILVPPGAGGAGGMEYPTLFTVGALNVQGPACFRMLEVETVHELAHQWFQSVVATDEAEEPWLDEGFADYSTVRAMNALYDGALSSCGGWTFSYLAMRRLEYRMMPDTPMAGRAWDFDGLTYGIATYSKPAVALSTLERRVGDAAMVAFLRAYTDQYAFAHPSAEDLRAVMAETLGAETADWFFKELVDGAGTLDAQVARLDAADADLARRGDLCVPVPVALRLTRTGYEVVRWPCGAEFQEEVDRLRGVEIDPERIALLDLNWVNNGQRRQIDGAAWVGAVVRTGRLLQTLFRGGGL
jgi:hypothetical protein